MNELKMSKDRKTKRKGKPKQLKTLIEEKKRFNLLPKDPLMDFIDATFRAKFTASSMDNRGNVAKKTEKGYDPKIFFHGTVFEEMFYPRPPGLSDIEEAFLNHPALGDAEVCECLRSSSNVVIGNVRDEQVASVPESGIASSREDWDFLVESVASLKFSRKEELLQNSGLTEGVRKKDGLSSSIAVKDSAKMSQSVGLDAEAKPGRSEEKKVKQVAPGTSKTVNEGDHGSSQEQIVRLKAMSSMMSEEEEEERELTSHESDTSTSGSVSSVCEVIFQKRVIVPDCSDTTRANIAKLIKDKFNMTPSTSKKTPVRPRNQDYAEPKTKKAVVDPECMIIEDPTNASSDSDVIVLSD